MNIDLNAHPEYQKALANIQSMIDKAEAEGNKTMLAMNQAQLHMVRMVQAVIPLVHDIVEIERVTLARPAPLPADDQALTAGMDRMIFVTASLMANFLTSVTGSLLNDQKSMNKLQSIILSHVIRMLKTRDDRMQRGEIEATDMEFDLSGQPVPFDFRNNLTKPA